MGAAEKYLQRYTIEEWKHWHDQWELIDGYPYCMSPAPNIQHQRILTRIWKQLEAELEICKKCEALVAPTDWRINEDTVVQPDVLVVCDNLNENFISKTPSLIFEVFSASTEKKDREVKFELYQNNGVKYYVMINPSGKSWDIYQLVKGEYVPHYPEDKFQFDLDDCIVDFTFNKLWD